MRRRDFLKVAAATSLIEPSGVAKAFFHDENSHAAHATYASPREVIRAGLKALKERDSAVERWLRNEVVPVYDAMRSDPGRAVPAAEVAVAVAARHADRVKRTKRGI